MPRKKRSETKTNPQHPTEPVLCCHLLCTGPSLKSELHSQWDSMEWTNFSPVSSCQLRASWLGMEDHVDFPLSGLRLHVAWTWAEPVHKAAAFVISYVCLYSYGEKHCFLGVKHSPQLLQAFVSSASQLPVSQNVVKWRSKEIFFKAFCTKNI